jgi:hypothetical protein
VRERDDLVPSACWYFSSYKGNMGRGEVVDSLRGDMVWKPAVPGSVDELIITSICTSAVK